MGKVDSILSIGLLGGLALGGYILLTKAGDIGGFIGAGVSDFFGGLFGNGLGTRRKLKGVITDIEGVTGQIIGVTEQLKGVEQMLIEKRAEEKRLIEGLQTQVVGIGGQIETIERGIKTLKSQEALAYGAYAGVVERHMQEQLAEMKFYGERGEREARWLIRNVPYAVRS